MKKTLIFFAATALLMAGCGRGGWQVKGTLAEADADTTLLVEAYDNGVWYALDTLRTGADGKFAYTAPAPLQHSDIMRLHAGNTTVYFPVDSAETVTVTTAGNGKYIVTGSETARQMMLADSIIDAAVAAQGVAAALESDDLKRALYTQVIQNDANGLASYYVINKQIGTEPLFDLSRKLDTHLYASVATKFKALRPTDPRTAYLEAQTLRARQANNMSKGVAMEAQEAKLPADISLYDSRGAQHTLSEVTAQGKVVVLSFLNYATEIAPAYNVEMNRVYQKYGPQGLEVYQVSFDADEALWKQSARNLPWIAVYDTPEHGINTGVRYNINVDAPTTYIINRQGDIVERIDNVSRLDAAVSKYM